MKLKNKFSFLIPFVADVKVDFISPNATCLDNKTDRIELICNATGNPISILAWTYSGQILASSTNESNSMAHFQNLNNTADDEQMQTKFVLENRHSDSLQIKLIIENCLIGEKRFNCVAFNEFSKDAQSVTVTGNSKPILTSSTNDTFKSANESSSITIDCDVNGYPQPTIIWLKVKFFVIDL